MITDDDGLHREFCLYVRSGRLLNRWVGNPLGPYLGDDNGMLVGNADGLSLGRVDGSPDGWPHRAHDVAWLGVSMGEPVGAHGKDFI